MTAEKIRNAALSIGALAGEVRPDQWDLLSSIRCELLDVADQVAIFEKCMSEELLASAAAQEAAYG